MIQLWPQPGNQYYNNMLLEGLSKIDSININAYVSYKFQKYLNLNNIKIKKVYSPFNINLQNILPLILQPFTFILFTLKLFFDKSEIIHINFTHPWLTVLTPLLKKKFKIVQILHDIQPHIGEEKMRNQLAIKVALKYTDMLIVHGEILKERLINNYNILPERIVVIPHGNSDILLRFGNKEIKEEKNAILFAGRILPYKGLNILLDAFKNILRDYPDTKLIIAGPGDITPYTHQIESVKKNIEVYNYIISDDEFSNFFRRSSIIVLPYIEGSQSGPLTIACSFGKSIVCTNVGAFSEIIKNQINGIIVEPNDVLGLSNAILTLLKDETLRKKLGENAKKTAENDLSWDKIARMTLDVYKKII